MDLGLGGKVAIVTGGSKGIGRAVAEELAKEGARVAICARGQKELAEAEEAIRADGGECLATVADVSRPEDVERVVAAADARFGGVDVLVNNAGAAWMGHGIDLADEAWRHTLELNLMSAVRFTRAVAPSMRRRGGGRIVNVSTAGARTIHFAGMADYLSAKSAMLAFSRAAAIELAPDRILVNAVCPGFVDTPLQQSLLEAGRGILGLPSVEAGRELESGMTLVGRLGRAEEISAVIVFLASARASYVTGSIYDVDGGFTKSVI